MNLILIIGIISLVIGGLLYLLNILLIKYFINKKIPGLIDADMRISKPKNNEEYLWEKTAGVGVVPKWVSGIGILSYPIIFIGVILLLFSIVKYLSSDFNIHRAKKESIVLVIPGESIAGVELDMTYEQVISVLGNPAEKISTKDSEKLIGEFRVLGGDKLEGEMPEMEILNYKVPPLVIVLGKDKKVNSLQLGYTDNVKVQRYNFLKFKYLSRKELNRIGNPSSVTRDKQAEIYLKSKAYRELNIEYYVHEYDEIGLWLGLVFDKAKEQESRYFIGLNYIALIKEKLLT